MNSLRAVAAALPLLFCAPAWAQMLLGTPIDCQDVRDIVWRKLEKPVGCDVKSCSDVGFAGAIAWIRRVTEWAKKLPEQTRDQQCIRNAYLYWMDFYAQQANTYHEQWNRERKLNVPAPPPNLLAPERNEGAPK